MLQLKIGYSSVLLKKGFFLQKMEESSDISSKKFPPDHLRIFVHQGEITKELIKTTEKIKHLLFAFSEIDNITQDFLQSLPDVENLILNGNQKFPKLTKSFFQNFPNLTLIYIHNNENLEVEENAFSDLPHLRILSLQGLNIPKLTGKTFENLNLKRLSMVKCNIEVVDEDSFSSMTNLEEINLSSNKIKEFVQGTFKGLHKLKELSVQNNDLGNLDVTKLDPLPSLEYVDLCDNKMTKLQTERIKELFPKLQKINAISNYFSETEIDNITKNLSGLGINLE